MSETTETRPHNLRAIADQLQSLPESSRKLLAHIVELACKAQGAGRQQDTAYLPELHESCGLDVEAMYETLEPLQRAGLIQVENQYPFEDVRLTASDAGKSVAAISRLCKEKNVTVRDVIGELRFDLLE